MLKKETVIQDLNDMCADTNANWLCALDIYTPDIQKDESKFLPAYAETGLSKKYMLLRGEVSLEYGGSLRFNFPRLFTGGYTLLPPPEKKPIVILPGFDMPVDQAAAYHECAHLYQRKHDLFNSAQNQDDLYQKYLKEVHANTFANMALMLRADSVLSFKKQRLSCFAQEVQSFNQANQTSILYISLPITLELLRTIRREGRAYTLQKFSQDGKLDFQKIAFYTADFVKQHAYSRAEFEKIINNQSFYSYGLIKQRAKAWHQLGENYVHMQQDQMAERLQHYSDIERQRKKQTDLRIKKLPETNKKAKIINAVCAIDTYRVHLNQRYGIFADLDDLISNKTLKVYDHILNQKEKKEIADLSANIKELCQTWQNNPLFKKLYNQINHPDTRDQVWALKFEQERRAEQRPLIFKLFER